MMISWNPVTLDDLLFQDYVVHYTLKDVHFLYTTFQESNFYHTVVISIGIWPYVIYMNSVFTRFDLERWQWT